MPKMRKQIISPHVRFAASSRGPYANKLGGGMYAKSFGLREAAASFIAFGEDSAGVIKALVKGQGAVTFERQTTATVETGPDGLIEECLQHEIRHKKGRRESNLCTGYVTETITVINGNDYQLTIAGDNNANAVCSGAFTGTLTADGTNRISWPSGTPKTASSTSLTITVTGTLTQMLLQDVTGRSNQNPSENIPAGEADGTNFSYAGGVRCYAKTNPCQVSVSGVVTEDAATTPITDYRTLFEPASTNYTDDSNDLSGGAETVDLTAGGTGDFTLSVSGTAAVTVAAGTATGTGFGQATAGNPVTFNLTSTGTVTLTLDSGSLDTAQGGQAVKQVEPGSTATSFIITDGSPPVTRTADDPAPFADISNFDLTKGTFVWDLTMAAAVDQGIIGFANAQAGVCSYNASAGRFETTDGTNTAFVDPSLASNLGDIIRFAVLYSTDNGLRIGYRNVTDAGPWVWDTNSAAFDGAFTSNDVFNATFGLATPTTFKYLEYYSVDKTKQWVEDNK